MSKSWDAPSVGSTSRQNEPLKKLAPSDGSTIGTRSNLPPCSCRSCTRCLTLSLQAQRSSLTRSS